MASNGTKPDETKPDAEVKAPEVAPDATREAISNPLYQHAGRKFVVVGHSVSGPARHWERGHGIEAEEIGDDKTIDSLIEAGVIATVEELVAQGKLKFVE